MLHTKKQKQNGRRYRYDPLTPIKYPRESPGVIILINVDKFTHSEVELLFSY